MFASFADIAKDAARRLAEGAENRRSPMHTPVIATPDADVRIMVLRHFDAERWTLRFHTDARSPKVGVIGEGAPTGMLFYDREARIQIRVRGIGWIESSGPVADAAWAESTNFARRCYLGDGPGFEADGPTSGLPDWIEGNEPTEEQVASARGNFAVLLVEAAEVDWFFLAHDGHRRAVLDVRTGDGRWIAP